MDKEKRKNETGEMQDGNKRSAGTNTEQNTRKSNRRKETGICRNGSYWSVKLGGNLKKKKKKSHIEVINKSFPYITHSRPNCILSSSSKYIHLCHETSSEELKKINQKERKKNGNEKKEPAKKNVTN